MTVDNPQDALRSLFDAALAAADPALTVPPHLPAPPAGRTVVVGAGKASAAMAEAVEATARAFDAVVEQLPEAVARGRGERWVEGVFGLHARHAECL